MVFTTFYVVLKLPGFIIISTKFMSLISSYLELVYDKPLRFFCISIKLTFSLSILPLDCFNLETYVKGVMFKKENKLFFFCFSCVYNLAS